MRLKAITKFSCTYLLNRIASFAAFLIATLGLTTASAVSAEVQKFGNSQISVFLCPNDCPRVRGHPFRPGGKARVYETREGWVRVSRFLEPGPLKAKFGNAVPKKPALWVRQEQLAGYEKPAPAQPDETTTSAENSSEPVTSETAQTKLAKKPKARTVAQKRKVTLPTFRPDSANTTVANKPAKPEPKPVAKEVKSPEPQVAKAEETPKSAVKKPDPKPVETAEKDTSSPSGTDVKPVKPQSENTDSEPKKVELAATTPAAPPETKPEKSEGVSYSAPKAEESLAKETAAVVTTQSKPEKPAAETAVSTQKIEQETSEQAVAAATQETEQVTLVVPEDTTIEPLLTEERPTKYIKALDDRRLRKLPGRKSKRFKREEVIALRHHALMLLKNEQCKGITKGGRSASRRGYLFVVCTDDPTYLHQFPLEELTW